jgi:hypothetical protein
MALLAMIGGFGILLYDGSFRQPLADSKTAKYRGRV